MTAPAKVGPAELLLRRVERMRAQDEPTWAIRRFLDSARARRQYGDAAAEKILDLIRRGQA